MSALAHYLEDEGIPTTLISLIRLHTEKVAPPRAIWVPFELGRPLGAPNDAGFQRRVLLSALALLERKDGPVILEDFPDEAPGSTDDPAWQSPVALPALPPVTDDAAAVSEGLRRELAAVLPWRQTALERHGRSGFGLSGLEIDEVVAYLGAFLAGTAVAPRPEEMPAVQTLRFAIDDLKALYLEAAAAGGGRASSRQLANWFWDHTFAARVIIRLREVCMASDDRRTKITGTGQFIPGGQVVRLGLG